MNKQEAIERIESRAFTIEDADLVVGLSYTKNIINQIDEQQKVTIPKFVAEWIEGCKRSGWHLQKALYRLDDDEKVGDWAYDENDDLIFEKVDVFARAWLDGYTVEAEKLYTVEIPDPHGLYKIRYLFRNSAGNIRIGGSDYRDIFLDAETHLTEAEIKQDFEWAWQWAKEVEAENDTEV